MPTGTVFAYDQAESDQGNALKTTKKLAARVVLDHLAARPDCTGKLGALGICIGGHLDFRAAMHPDMLGAACFYATETRSWACLFSTVGESVRTSSDVTV